MIKKLKAAIGIVNTIVTLLLILFFRKVVFPNGQTDKFTRYFVLVLCLLVFVVWIVGYSLLTEKVTIKMGCTLMGIIVWGTIFSLSLPPMSAPDEIIHYPSSHQLAFFLSSTEKGSADYSYISGVQGDARHPNAYTYETILNNYKDDITESENKNTKDGIFRKIKNNYRIMLKYAPSALGIKLARTMGANNTLTMYVGRLFNTVYFALIVCLAIWI